MYKATHNETGEVIEMTEAQVREEVYETSSSDMGTAFNYTDEEIREGAMNDSFDDLFDGDTFEAVGRERLRIAA